MADIMQNIGVGKDKWVDRFFRMGFISKGVVYCLVGILALMAATGLSNKEAGKTDVLQLIYDQPFGKILLIVVAIGLFGYVTLRFFQAFKDIDGKGSDTKGIIARIGYGISGAIYLTLAIYAAKLVLNSAQKGGGDSQKFVITKVLSYSWGEWALGLAGLIIIGSGIYQIYRAVSGKFMKKIQLIRSNIEKTVRNAGVTGYLSRGLVLIIIGYLIFHAAITSNPDQAQGTTSGAFHFIENEFGGVLLGLIAIGMVGYGVFMFVKAKYQRINVA